MRWNRSQLSVIQLALCVSVKLFVLSVPKKISMPKSQFKAKHKGEKRESHHKQCVPPCVRYLCAGDTHSLCVVCLGMRHAEAALEGADWPHCESLPLRLLCSWKGPLLQRGLVHKRSLRHRRASAEAERSGGSARGVHSTIWWRDRGGASLYLHLHLLDPMTAPRDWKPARRILPLGQRPRRFSCLIPWKVTLGKSTLLFCPSMRSWWRWSLVPWPSWISTG